MLEPATWTSLSAFYIVHILLSAFLARRSAASLRKRYRDNPRMLFLFFLFFNIALPGIGYLFTFWLNYYLLNVEYAPVLKNSKVLNMEELDQEFPQVKRAFGEGSMVELMSNALAPHMLRMRALSAMAENMTRKNVALIKHSLSDRDDEIRLYSFSLISNMEYGLNNKVHDTTQRYKNAKSEEERIDAAKELAFLYWEMVYFDLSDDILKNYLMDESLKYALIVSHVRIADHNINLLLGKIYLAKKEFENATTQFILAIESGVDYEYIIPYLAELYFQRKNYRSIRSMLGMVKDLNMNTTMHPVIEQWRA